MSASLQRAMSSLEEKELGLQQALQDTRVAESRLAQVSFLVHGHRHGDGHGHGRLLVCMFMVASESLYWLWRLAPLFSIHGASQDGCCGYVPGLLHTMKVARFFEA